MNILWILYIAGVGVNPGKQTVYHMCKTWLKKVHGGRVRGVTFKSKNKSLIQFSCVLFHVERVKVHCTE